MKNFKNVYIICFNKIIERQNTIYINKEIRSRNTIAVLIAILSLTLKYLTQMMEYLTKLIG